MFERNDKKLIIFASMAVFARYCPQFWGFGLIYKVHDTLYMFERHDKKLIVFVFMVVFISYCPQFWGSGLIYRVHDT
jgi:hypothetical protein